MYLVLRNILLKNQSTRIERIEQNKHVDCEMDRERVISHSYNVELAETLRSTSVR